MFGREFWISAVDEFARSKSTQERFARQRGIPATTLRTWIYKLRRERKASVSLVPVRVVAPTAPPARSTAVAARRLPASRPLRSLDRLRAGPPTKRRASTAVPRLEFADSCLTR